MSVPYKLPAYAVWKRAPARVSVGVGTPGSPGYHAPPTPNASTFFGPTSRGVESREKAVADGANETMWVSSRQRPRGSTAGPIGAMLTLPSGTTMIRVLCARGSNRLQKKGISSLAFGFPSRLSWMALSCLETAGLNYAVSTFEHRRAAVRKVEATVIQ